MAIAVLVGYSWRAWNYERPYISGYKTVAERILADKNAQMILFDGNVGPDFIFFMRVLDPGQRCYVLRKALYVTDILNTYGSENLISNSAQLEGLIRDYGVKYIVVENGIPLSFESQRILRNLLQRPQFRFVEEVPFKTDLSRWGGRSVLLYENEDVSPRRAQALDLKMMTLNHDIVVPLPALPSQPLP